MAPFWLPGLLARILVSSGFILESFWCCFQFIMEVWEPQCEMRSHFSGSVVFTESEVSVSYLFRCLFWIPFLSFFSVLSGALSRRNCLREVSFLDPPRPSQGPRGVRAELLETLERSCGHQASSSTENTFPFQWEPWFPGLGGSLS